MSRQILVNAGSGPQAALLPDIDNGRLVPSGLPETTPGKGSAAVVEGHAFAVHADDGTLWLQWDDARWPVDAPDLALAYRHDLNAATTAFSADGRSITYPAWWRGDPTFDPMLPEEDEVYDYLAHVMAVRRRPALRKALLDAA